MGFRKFLPIFLIFISIYLTLASAKKSEKTRTSSKLLTEIQEREGVEISLSSELQELKDLGNNVTATTTTTKKPKHHRRKNKHHNRRGQVNPSRSRVHKKKRTRPMEILTAEDDDGFTFINNGSEAGKVGKRPSTKSQSINPSRGVRHLDSEREVANGRSGHSPHKNHHFRQHRRRRFHHKKHGKINSTSETTLESPK